MGARQSHSRISTRRLLLEALDRRDLLTGDISGAVWHDSSLDGVRDYPVDRNVSGVDVRLYDAGGTALAEDSTNSDGNFNFNDLPSGQYTLEFQTPDSWRFSAPHIGMETRDSDVDPATGRFTFQLTGASSTVDAGVYAEDVVTPLEVLVWEDLDANGLLDTGEPLVNTVELDLEQSTGSNDNMGVFQIGADGRYHLVATSEPLLPDQYVIHVKPDSDRGTPRLSPRGRGAGTGAIDSDPQPLSGKTGAFSLTDSPADPPVVITAGFYFPAVVTGIARDDANRDGLLDVAEPPLQGVFVRLLDSAGTVIGSQRTNAAGAYQFTDVEPGNYQIEVTRPDGTSFTSQGDSDINPSTGRTGLVAVRSGSTVLLDVGLLATGGQPRIMGRAWDDVDGDGIEDSGEGGVAGVQVNLLYANGSQAASLVTGADGRYSFVTSPGSYMIEVVAPTGTTIGPMSLGGDDRYDSDINRVTRRSALIPLISGQSDANQDVGIYRGALSTDAVSQLRITEVGFVGHGYSEFLEVRNIGAEPLDLQGVQFIDGIQFQFSGSGLTSLFPGEYAVIAGPNNALAQRVDTTQINVVTYSGDLNRTERLTLVDSVGSEILSFRYNDDWFIILDREFGAWTLTVLDETAHPSYWGQGSHWRPSSGLQGSPGGPDSRTTPDPGAVVINEVITKSLDGFNDRIEIHNTTGQDIDIGNWYLGDSDNAVDKLIYLTRYQFAPGTIVPAHGYRTFSREEHFGNAGDAGSLHRFGLSSFGETLHLVAANRYGQMLGYSDSATFGGSLPGMTYGRHPRSDGGSNFVLLDSPTLGDTNAPPLVDSIVINEVLYNPGFLHQEFIEIFNVTQSDIVLNDAENEWRLANAVDFSFPLGATIPARGHALVTGIDPNLFRSMFSVPANVPVFGPFSGVLDNGGELVDLLHSLKTDTQLRRSGQIAKTFLVDQLRYDDDHPWPIEADTQGHAIERRAPAAFGNDVTSWAASLAPGGTPGRVNSTTLSVYGDCNGDGTMSSGDIDFLTTMLRITPMPSYATLHDMNHDGSFTRSDIDHLITSMFSTTYGDVNLDRAVSLDDLLTIKRNYGRTSGATWSTGDVDGDGDVDRTDLASLTRNFGFYSPTIPPPSPESPSGESTPAAPRVDRAVLTLSARPRSNPLRPTSDVTPSLSARRLTTTARRARDEIFGSLGNE